MNYTDAHYVCNQNIGEVDSGLPHYILEWQQVSVHETCSHCAAMGPIYNLTSEVPGHVITTNGFERCTSNYGDLKLSHELFYVFILLHICVLHG